jgi:Xaa-Pro aminopeptidase
MRPLADGDLIISEYHTKYGGYVCHTEYTVYMGKRAPDKLNDIWKVCIECLDISQEVMVPGMTLREAWERIRRPCEKAGYDFVELGWHGMGNGSPEFPTVIYPPGYGPKTLNGGGIGDFVFEEGMTFGNNIDINDPNWKFDVGCVLSDFMVVRPGKAELLVNVPRELGVVG